MATAITAYRIVLCNYKNYFDRCFNQQTPLGATYSDDIISDQYGDDLVDLFSDKINFNIGDGLNSSIVIDDETFFAGAENANYALIFATNTGVPKQLNSLGFYRLVASYFVIKSTKEQYNRFRLDLRRDVLADFRNQIVNLPAFVERGMLMPSNPLFFQEEGLKFNQIKKQEILLKDDSRSGWIVGYIARNDEGQQYSVNASTDSLVDYGGIPSLGSLKAKFQRAISTGTMYGGWQSNKVTIRFDFKTGGFAGTVPFYIDYPQFFKSQGNRLWELRSQGALVNRIIFNNDGFFMNYPADRQSVASGFNYYFSDAKWGTIKSAAAGLIDADGDFLRDIELEELDGLHYKYNGAIYKVKVERVGDLIEDDSFITINNNNTFQTELDSIAANFAAGFFVGDNPTTVVNQFATGQLMIHYYEYKISVSEVFGQEVNATIPTTRNKLVDAPYDMFCLPYGEVSVKGLGTTFITRRETSLAVATALAEQLGTRLYDLQLLPYCPIQSMISADHTNLDANGEIDFTSIAATGEGSQFELIKTTASPNTTVGFILFPQKSVFDFKIQNLWRFGPNDTDLQSLTWIEQKTFLETTVTRIVSPNYSSMFEFNVGKNGWTIEYYKVSCTYKPFNPFVMVSIDFKGLYGNEFNDSRGLILSGDFSLSVANSAWVNYEIANKNYQIMFDRQIQHMDEMYNINRDTYMFRGLMNVGKSGIAGLMSAALGGGWGGIASGAVGVLGSGLQTNFGLAQNQFTYAEERSYAFDTYQYNLGNIQALPHSLTKVTSLNNINKIFPFLEIYEASDTEKVACENYFKEKSYKVGAFGTLADYMYADMDLVEEKCYLQANIVRFDGLAINDFLASQIYAELSKGVYDNGYYSTDFDSNVPSTKEL